MHVVHADPMNNISYGNHLHTSYTSPNALIWNQLPVACCNRRWWGTLTLHLKPTWQLKYEMNITEEYMLLASRSSMMNASLFPLSSIFCSKTGSLETILDLQCSIWLPNCRVQGEDRCRGSYTETDQTEVEDWHETAKNVPKANQFYWLTGQSGQ